MCPLCGGENTLPYTEDRFRKYLVCLTCALVFVPEQYHVSEKQERTRYDLHNNHPDDPVDIRMLYNRNRDKA